jgi:tetratricopeptide (TPR) repeat protein
MKRFARRAIKLKPDFQEAWSDRGAARQFKGDFDGALADYNLAIKLNPRFADAWFNRATYWREKGDKEPSMNSEFRDFGLTKSTLSIVECESYDRAGNEVKNDQSNLAGLDNHG